MEFKITNPTERSRNGFTLVEAVVALGVSTVVFAAIMTFYAFAGRSFASMVNYWDLDRKSRAALDQMSSDIRRSLYLQSSTTNQLVFRDINGLQLGFAYNPTNKTLSRTSAGVTSTLLTECDSLQFKVFQRTPIAGSYEQFSNATAFECKVVQLEWICSRKVLGNRLNTESVQSAKIVIRSR